MCMQDLAIARRLVAQPVKGLYAVSASITVIPANPRRVALYVTNTNDDSSLRVSLGNQGEGPVINQDFAPLSPSWTYRSYMTISDTPGIAVNDLAVPTPLSDVAIWEVVPDSELDAAVTLLAANLTR